MKRFVVSIGVVSAAMLAAGTAGAEEDVAALWAKHCASYHGADGKAQTKMGKILKVADLTNPDVRAGFDRAKMIAATKDGVLKDDGKTPWMPGFAGKLSDEQIAALTDYVIGDFGKSGSAPESE